MARFDFMLWLANPDCLAAHISKLLMDAYDANDGPHSQRYLNRQVPKFSGSTKPRATADQELYSLA